MIVVVAFDALEYNIVNKGDFPNLKQQEYGKVKTLGIEALKTPVIWASFITGKPPKEHKVEGFFKGEKIIVPLADLGCKIGLDKVIGIHRALHLMGFLRKYNKQHLSKTGIKTIFDFGKTKAISVPSYNEDIVNDELRDSLRGALKGRCREEQLVTRAWDNFFEKKAKALRTLQEDWDLFMVHFFITDVLQHYFFYDEARINDLYQEMDKTMREISEKIHNDCWKLVISDHGMKRGIHTNHGFYSSNKPLGLKEPKITDFYQMFQKRLRSRPDIASEKERRRILNHLRKLGYI